MTTAEHLDQLGVKRLPPRTCPLDPGYDPDSVVSHLSQSGHLMTSLKISTAGWLIADEASTRRKFEAARSQGVATVTGGTPFEVAVHQNLLPEYLEVCAELGAARVECARGFTEPDLSPEEVVGMAAKHGLGMDVELGGKHSGAFTPTWSTPWSRRAGAGAAPARTSSSSRHARSPATSGCSIRPAPSAPPAPSVRGGVRLRRPPLRGTEQGQPVRPARPFRCGDQLANVRLEELLRVEIYRRGLHADAFAKPGLSFVDDRDEQG